MKRWGMWLLYAALLGATGALSYATARRAESLPIPSVESTHAQGARGLYLYLKARGYDVRTQAEPLQALPADVKTLVLAGPLARPLQGGDVEALRRFVERGGQWIFLVPRPFDTLVPEVQAWLDVRPGGPLLGSSRHAQVDAQDEDGASVQVFRDELGLRALRTSSERGFQHVDSSFLPVAGTSRGVALAWRPEGAGEIWLGAGPDLLENRRLDLEDNLLFWERIAQTGPLAFDEWHHLAPPPPPPSRGLLWVGLELALLGVMGVWARAVRMGPPRPLVTHRHRSLREYLEAFAHLTQRSRVEAELLAESWERFRVLLQEQLGIAHSLTDDEVARELERQGRAPAADYLALAGEITAAVQRHLLPESLYVRLIRALAEFEGRLWPR